MTEDHLSELKSALEAGRVTDALNMYDDAESSIGNQESRERMWQKLARGIIARTDASAQANVAARQFTRTVGVADQARIAFHVGFASFAGDNLDAEELASKVDSVIDAHDAVDQRAETMIDSASGVSLPPTLGVFGPNDAAVPKGGTVNLEFTAENLGTVLVSDLEASVEGYDLDPSPEVVDTLDADESATIFVSGPASKAGSFSVAVRLAGEKAGDTASVGLTVLDQGDFLERALETLRDIQTTVESLSDGSSDEGNGSDNRKKDGDSGVAGLEAKLETAIERLEKLRNRSSNGGKSVDNRIESIYNLLGSFRNQTEALSGSQIAARHAAVLHHDAGQAMSLLSSAVDAEA